MSAPGQDAAQPGTAPDGQGQGQDRTDSYEGVLGPDVFNDAPEELRDHLVSYVKTKVDPFINQRFQESADFKSTWEPFSQIEGLTDLHPEDVDQLVELGYVIANASQGDEQAKEALRETWEQLGQQFEFFEDGDDDDAEEDAEDEPQYMTREEYEAERAQERQQSERQETVEQTRQELRAEVDKLPLGEVGSEKRQKAENAIYSFMLRYDDANMSNADAVKAAFEDYKELVGDSQEELVEETEERQTGTTLRGGGVDTKPEEVRSWADADKLAKARLSGV
jgi:hypothetical protein